MDEEKSQKAMRIAEDPSLNTDAESTIERFDIMVDKFLRNNVIKGSFEKRFEMTKAKFRSIVPYAKTSTALKKNCIISFNVDKVWVDWLEVKEGGLDSNGFGLFALQNIAKDMMFTVFIGVQKPHVSVDHEYAVEYWERIRKKRDKTNKKSYVVVEVTGKNKRKGKWMPLKDELYIGAHLINDVRDSNYSANAYLGHDLEITAKREIKVGEEILLDYKSHDGNKFIQTGRRRGIDRGPKISEMSDSEESI